MILGCIGDDATGSSDLANTLAKGGLATVQWNGVPTGPADPSVEAGVVALKSRTIPAADAVAQSLAALDWLRAQGCRQFLFKYCSTFDSTAEGNIGPVAEALREALGAEGEPCLFCPAFPGAGRTIHMGHLFVGDRLLSESGMEAHPLTPMTDPDLRRVLAAQSRAGVGHVRAGTDAAALRAAMDAEAAAGRPLIVADATTEAHLEALGAAARGLSLLTGGSGIALGLPEVYRRDGLVSGGGTAWRGEDGPAALLSGSCSRATRAQVAAYAGPKREIDADAVMAGTETADTVAAWLTENLGAAPLAYSSADPAAVTAAQARHGRDALATAIEAVFAGAARAVVHAGARRLIVAGGETSGAVVAALAPPAFEIGPEIDPGVPALRAGDMVLALKSGNFGRETFFARALDALAGKALT